MQPDGRLTRGRDDRKALQALVDNHVTLEIELGDVFPAGDVAIGLGTLTLNGTGHDGTSFAQRSESVVVYSARADVWRIALDAPWGLPTLKRRARATVRRAPSNRITFAHGWRAQSHHHPRFIWSRRAARRRGTS